MTFESPELVVARFAVASPAEREAMQPAVRWALAEAGKVSATLAAELSEILVEAVRRPVWAKVARPEQLPPGNPAGSIQDRHDWIVWLILAGRGFGKTRTGAEWSADKLRRANIRLALVAATFAAGRDDMVEGESGLLRCLPPSLLIDGSIERSWNRSLGELKLANNSRARIYSSEKPGQLRGPQHHFAWGDELAKWNDADTPVTDDSTWSNLMLGMRLGRRPQVCATTTPKPVTLLVGRRGEEEKTGILKAPKTVVTGGSTYDNIDNLAETFREVILGWEGTRLGRQELYAEILGDVEGALWETARIERLRVTPGYEVGVAGGLTSVVVGVDPSVGQGDKDHDECGIVVAGRAQDGDGFVIADRSLTASPMKWAETVVVAYHEHQADAVVAEQNNGGELVRTMIHVADPNVPVALVSATRNKQTRAEPVSALYEADRIRHIGIFPKLEDQLTRWVPGEGDSPDRLDALVWAFTRLFRLGPNLGKVTKTTRARAASDRR